MLEGETTHPQTQTNYKVVKRGKTFSVEVVLTEQPEP